MSAYDEGVAAKQADKSRETNPYKDLPTPNRNAFEWDRGWYSAKVLPKPQVTTVTEAPEKPKVDDGKH